MHTIFHTDAIVLGTYPTNEANKTVILFTRELGILKVRAQGVRKSAAKLRSHIIDYSVVNTDLVKGRGIWRMTSARMLTNPLLETKQGKHARAYVRMLGLIERFSGEEIVQPELFDHIVEVATHVGDQVFEEKNFDTFILWKCMVLLGYVAAEEKLLALFEKKLPEAVNSISFTENETMIKQVNASIQQSHL